MRVRQAGLLKSTPMGHRKQAQSTRQDRFSSIPQHLGCPFDVWGYLLPYYVHLPGVGGQWSASDDMNACHLLHHQTCPHATSMS